MEYTAKLLVYIPVIFTVMVFLLVQIFGRLLGPNSEGAAASVGFGLAVILSISMLISPLIVMCGVVIGGVLILTKALASREIKFAVLIGLCFAVVVLARFYI